MEPPAPKSAADMCDLIGRARAHNENYITLAMRSLIFPSAPRPSAVHHLLGVGPSHRKEGAQSTWRPRRRFIASRAEPTVHYYIVKLASLAPKRSGWAGLEEAASFASIKLAPIELDRAALG